MIADYIRANPDIFMSVSGVIITVASIFGLKYGLQPKIGTQVIAIGLMLIVIGILM